MPTTFDNENNRSPFHINKTSLSDTTQSALHTKLINNQKYRITDTWFLFLAIQSIPFYYVLIFVGSNQFEDRTKWG
jgi:hypothetical protein